MIKLSVSKAAKMLGISRVDIQKQINTGKLQTHEGYVTIDSLRLAYPSANLCSEQDKHLEKMQQIKNDAVFKAGSSDTAQTQSEKIFTQMIATLKTQLQQKELENQRYKVALSELSLRLGEWEKSACGKEKSLLKALQKQLNF